MNKRNYLISLLFFFCISSFNYAQSKNIIEQDEHGITLKIQDLVFPFSDTQRGNFTIRDYYQFNDPSQAGKFKLPYRIINIALPSNIHPTVKIVDKKENMIEGIIPALNEGVILKNDSTVSNIVSDYKNIQTYNDNNILVEGPKFIWINNVYCAQLKINSHLFNSRTNQMRILEKIELRLEFSNSNYAAYSNGSTIDILSDSLLANYIYNFKNATRIRPYYQKVIKDSTYDWIDFSNPLIKYSTASNTIFRIYKKDIVDNGLVEPNVDPRTFRLYDSGKEVPIYVKGQEDGSFDNGDYIEFVGGLNYSKKSYRTINADNEEYNEYLNRYTDSLFFFLQWGMKTGKRVPVQSSVIPAADTLDYYMQNDHYEKNLMVQNLNGDELANQYPDWNKNKTWYWNWLFTNASYSVELNSIYKNKKATIYYKAVGAGSSISTKSHQIILKMNGTKIDSQSIDRFKQVLLKGTVDSNSLIEGNNQIVVSNIPNGSSPNYLGYDWYEIEYPKQLIVQNDSLVFTVDPGLDKKIRYVKIKNVNTSDIVIYKTKPVVKKIESYQKNGSNLVFSDTTAGGDQYYFISVQKINAPVFNYHKNFFNLRNNSIQADYIVITHTNFLSGAQAYSTYIGSVFIVTPIVMNINDIFDEFSFGYPYPEAIKSFLMTASSLWKVPKPKYVVLIGDADYDYKRFRFNNDGVTGGGNYVPSFGFPVSDYWFTVWDSSSFIPQMSIGRLPVNTLAELNRYTEKVKNYFETSLTGWNKKYIFFSGGNGSNAEEINLFKTTNDAVINNYILPKPVGGEVNHFYKTISPQSDFGPISPVFFNTAIDNGAVVISYLGHSGTSTWDNSINDITQLKNKLNKNPLVLDFGCSTAKFAEPDVVCFGERFLLDADGQAIAYIGNSSLGFIGTSTIAPQKFFEALSIQPVFSIGDLMISTKQNLLLSYGITQLNKIYVLTNVLLGDPVIGLKIPQKPNLYLDQNSFLSKDITFGEQDDSAIVKYLVMNTGRVEQKNYQVSFVQRYNGNIISRKNILRVFPLFYDTLTFWIKTKNYPGQHSLELNLDPLNLIDEIYKNDNNITTQLNVYSSSLRDILPNLIENSVSNVMNILNPVQGNKNQFNINYEIADNSSFQNSILMKIPAEQMFTKISLSNLQANKRYWFHYKIDDINLQYSPDKSFYFSNTPPFFLNDQYSFSRQKYEQTTFSSGHVQLGIDTVVIKAYSAGTYAGSTCVISKNGINLLANNYFAGIGVVVFDENTLNVEYSDWYQLFNDPVRMKQLAAYLNSIPEKKITALAVSDDAANNITDELINAVKAFGSTKIDSLKFRGSWAMISKKNAKPGEVFEKIARPYNGSVQVERELIKLYDSGKMTTRRIGPASSWKKLIYTLDPAYPQLIKATPIGFDKNNKADTLTALQCNNGIADLSQIDPKKYAYLQIKTELTSAQGVSPYLNSLGVDFTGVPELGTNYQGVTVDKDTLEQGEKINLSFSVFNAGQVKAENFKVVVEVLNKENTREKILEKLVDSLGSGQKTSFTSAYSSLVSTGKIQFLINIDPDNKNNEMYSDNNIYSISAFIKPNTKPASLRLTFDGSDIMDGDYISSTPKIKIELNDLSLLPIADTNAVRLFLNNKRINYLNNPVVNYSFSSGNPKLVINYKPVLTSGSYNLKVVGFNASGQVIDTNGVQKNFNVQNELRVSEVFNYPNPFAAETYFTFKLTQIPDEIIIKIFTVAGRMIKEIKKNAAELRFDLNKVYWDGRDNDGDRIANGVYLYKIIAKRGSETVTSIQKLVVMK